MRVDNDQTKMGYNFKYLCFNLWHIPFGAGRMARVGYGASGQRFGDSQGYWRSGSTQLGGCFL